MVTFQVFFIKDISKNLKPRFFNRFRQSWQETLEQTDRQTHKHSHSKTDIHRYTDTVNTNWRLKPIVLHCAMLCHFLSLYPDCCPFDEHVYLSSARCKCLFLFWRPHASTVDSISLSLMVDGAGGQPVDHWPGQLWPMLMKLLTMLSMTLECPPMWSVISCISASWVLLQI